MDLRAIIEEHNPHWKGAPREERLPFRRDAVLRLTEALLAQSGVLETRRAHVLTGLRRVGKSTVLRQVIAGLMERDVPPSSVLYFEMDDPRTQGASLEDILQASGFESSWSAQRPRFLLLDEVGHDRNWKQSIKRLADLRGAAPCVVVADSVAARLKPSEWGESAVGRRTDVDLEPLSFGEVARARGLLVTDPRDADGPALSLEADTYLLRGGMPSAVLSPGPGPDAAYPALRSDAALILTDAPRIREIRHPETLRLLWSILSENPAIALNIKSISEKIGRARETTEQLLAVIRELLLLRELPVFGGGPFAPARNPSKYFVADSGIAAAHLSYRDRAEERVRGPLTEVAILRHLAELAGPAFDAKLGYARIAKDAEVDFVIERPDLGRVAVEAKYSPRQTDDRTLEKLVRLAKAVKACSSWCVRARPIAFSRWERRCAWPNRQGRNAISRSTKPTTGSPRRLLAPGPVSETAHPRSISRLPWRRRVLSESRTGRACVAGFASSWSRSAHWA